MLIEDDAPIGLGRVANNHNRQASAHFGQREQVFYAVPFFDRRGTEDYRRRPPIAACWREPRREGRWVASIGERPRRCSCSAREALDYLIDMPDHADAI